MKLERMAEFFDHRADGYDEHMLSEVEGCKQGYQMIAKFLPQTTQSVLDLGCGTGLELVSVFERFPSVAVTGIDLSSKMLQKLNEKFSDKNITAVLGSYFGRDFGESIYDAAVSFQTMHHMSHEDKLLVYQNIFRSLKWNGVYIECDYMLTDPAEEEALYAENKRLRLEQNIPEGAFFHFDTPCTIEHQTELMKQAGFAKAEFRWREGNTTMITAEK